MSEMWQKDFINNFLAATYFQCRHNKQGMCKNDRCDQYGEFVDAQFCREICPHFEQVGDISVEKD